jgi:hypothetical protein
MKIDHHNVENGSATEHRFGFRGFNGVHHDVT